MKFLLTFIMIYSLSFSVQIEEAENYKDALQKGKQQNKMVLMFVYNEFCPWCEKMKRETFTDPKTIAFINKKYIFLKVDQDKDKFPARFNPRFIPTTYLIDPKTREEEYALYGFKSTKDFINELQDD